MSRSNFIFSDFVSFEWDEGNQDKNLIKHQVATWECEQIFFNDPLIILEDKKHSQSEQRYAAFGKTNLGRLLTIIFTKRKGLIRVISARAMHRKERSFYEKN